MKERSLRQFIGRDSARLLVVDDEEPIRAFLRGTLSLLGYEVTTACSGEECLEFVRRQVPDLILLDVMMGGIDGYETCRRLKALPEMRDVPVIFLTAMNDLDSRLQGFESGAADYISKPLQDAEIVARVEVHLSRYFARQDLREYAANLEHLVDSRTRLLVRGDRLMTVGMMAAKVLHEISAPLQRACSHLDAAIHRLHALHGQTSASDAVGELTVSMDQSLQSAREAVAGVEEVAAELRSVARRTIGGDCSRHPLAKIIQTAIESAGTYTQGLLRYDVEVDPSIVIDCNSRLLEKIFVNLIANSADAVGPKGGVVRIAARSHEGLVLVEFTDDGPGVPPELQGWLFEPFFSTKGECGAGLGLVIAREIARQHGGDLLLRSSSPSGASFALTLQIHGGSEFRI